MNFSLWFWLFFSTHHETFVLVLKASMTSFGLRHACFSPSLALQIVQFSSRSAWCSMIRPMVHHSIGGCLKRVGKKWNLLVFYVFCSAIRECRCCVQRIESCSSNAFRSRVWFSWGFQRAFYSVLTNEKKKKLSAWPLRDLTSHLGNAAAVHPHPNTIQASMSARDRDRREREVGNKTKKVKSRETCVECLLNSVNNDYSWWCRSANWRFPSEAFSALCFISLNSS